MQLERPRTHFNPEVAGITKQRKKEEEADLNWKTWMMKDVILKKEEIDKMLKAEKEKGKRGGIELEGKYIYIGEWKWWVGKNNHRRRECKRKKNGWGVQRGASREEDPLCSRKWTAPPPTNQTSPQRRHNSNPSLSQTLHSELCSDVLKSVKEERNWSR